MKLTDRTVKAIEPPAKRYRLIADEDMPGFALRIMASGTRSFILRYTADGRERRMTIGSFPAWTATAARERARELRRQIDSGADPLGAKEQRRAEATWAELVSLYLEVEAATQRRGWEYEQILNRETLPAWGKRRAADIRRRDVIELIESKAKSAPIAANRLFELIRRVFNFAIRRDIIDASPCVQVKKPGIERSKDRVLSRDEIKKLWTALDGPHFTKRTAAALRLILATAQRPGEVCGMHWADVDLTEGVWTIPAERAKNGLAHRVPLNATARAILKGLKRRGEWVFPKNGGGGPIGHNTPGQALYKALKEPKEGDPPRPEGREPLPLAKFSAHDLRRTAASKMAEEEVQRFVIGRVLNHAEPGVTRVYDRHGYDKEKRAALDTWDRLLSAIVEGKPTAKVVELRGA